MGSEPAVHVPRPNHAGGHRFDDLPEAHVPHECLPGPCRMEPRHSTRRSKPDLSGVVQQRWNGSTTIELDLGDIASDAFHVEISSTHLHNPIGLSSSSTDVRAMLTFTLTSLASRESLSGGCGEGSVGVVLFPSGF